MKPDDLPLAAVAPRDAWRAVYDAACAPFGRLPGINGRWAWHWARGKLKYDPAFRGLLEQGLLLPGARVVDIGCGQGLVASLLNACAQVSAAGAWPKDWPAAPSATAYTGIELMARETRRAQAALAALPFSPRFVTGDMRHTELPPCDLIVILDVLHYVNHAAQAQLLRRVRVMLNHARGPGRLLLRVGDVRERRGWLLSQWVDRIVTAVRGHRHPPRAGRPLTDWMALLLELGFAVEAIPMSQGTPFANVLLVADVHPR